MFEAIQRARLDFPILNSMANDRPLVFLDSAASSQKPQCVMDAMTAYYQHSHANVHRGLYQLSERATQAYEEARKAVQQFINAKYTHEIIFTKGTTESINLVASSFASLLKAGDEILISEMEHHSNIVPWQMLCEKTGAILQVILITDQGELDWETFTRLVSKKVKLLAITHISNVLGTVNPIHSLIEVAHAYNIPVLIDGAQAAPHMALDVQTLNCEFYTFSAHKMYGPTGIGVLYGKEEWLHQLPPYQGGGSMIETVSFEKTTYAGLPQKFEAGTPPIAEAVGLHRAIKYLNQWGLEQIQAYEHYLLTYLETELKKIPSLRIYGQAPEKASVVSFALENIHPHDIATILDHEGIAVRAGHHCAMPLMRRFKVPAMARASLAFYNNREDIEALCRGLEKVKTIMVAEHV